ncbi:MAG: ribosome biogenesis GTPase Der [Proteobacteria bacterium]|nr:ribosome biogenesis GTPase Der [Pseudomonadota bacterium]
MSLTVAIVGRPNVGKSTLFNRLAGRRLALVDDLPGVTRDRREADASLGDIDFRLIDTAGLVDPRSDSLSAGTRRQTQAAIALADLVLFVIDARSGPIPVDGEFADLVRKTGKTVVLVANKCERGAGTAGLVEAYRLGLGDPVAISAEHGEGLADLYAALRVAVPDKTAAPAERARAAATLAPDAARAMRIAVVGRPNVGKSTLINRLVGEERLLTGPEPGITRDAIAVDVAWAGQRLCVYDTAGLRRRSRIAEKLEKLSVADTIEAIRFAEVVVLLVDVLAPFEEQDLRIADLVEREGRAIVIGVNKCDMVEGAGDVAPLRARAEYLLPQIKGTAVVAVSGLTGAGLERLMRALFAAHAIWNRRIPTPALNRWLAQALAANPPPAVSGRRIRLDYITQAKARPPSFVLFCARADALPEAYRRYLVNGLRATFDLPGTPIRLTLREKKNPYAARGSKRRKA